MAANTSPIFTLTPVIAMGKTITTANTAKDGTGTVVTVYTAGTNGSAPLGVIFRPIGTNVASVGRIFINNGSTNTSAANNALIGEITLPAVTISEISAQPEFRWAFPDGFRLPNAYVVNVTIGTTVAAGFAVSCYGSDY